MGTKIKIVWSLLGGLILLTLLAGYLKQHTVAVLQPAGTIGSQEKQLMVFAFYLMVLVVVPVFMLAFGIAWRYRDSRPKKATYAPDWDHNLLFETLWWGIPFAIIATLAVVAWNSSHTLDPFRPLAAAQKPLTIQVVALQWKWLFIYPEQHIASVNSFDMPVGTPINFEITSDAPMNSFWIPQLGGQVYAMSGMSTQLHLMASKPGDYRGVSANISGNGFSGMHFIAHAESDSDFTSFVHRTQENKQALGQTAYTALAAPSEDNPVSYYGHVDSGLYDAIIAKYMSPDHQEVH